MKISHLVIASALFLVAAAGVGLVVRNVQATPEPAYLHETVQRADIEASVMAMGAVDGGGQVVRAAISEVDIAKVKIGQDAYFNSVTTPAQRFHGRVVSITAMPASFTPPPVTAPAKDAAPAAAETDEATAEDEEAPADETADTTAEKKNAPRADVFYTVVFRVDQVLPRVPSVMVHVVQGVVKQVPSISRLALQKQVSENRYMVQVYGADGRLSERAVDTGLADDLAIEVKGGLKLGEVVAIKDDGTLWEPGFRG